MTHTHCIKTLKTTAPTTNIKQIKKYHTNRERNIMENVKLREGSATRITIKYAYLDKMIHKTVLKSK